LAAFWSLHIGIWLTFSIGIFSITSMAAWMVFVPTIFWDRWSPTSSGPAIGELKGTHSPPSLITNLIAVGLLLFVIAINVTNSLPTSAQSAAAKNATHELGRLGMVVQEFNLFGEPPLHSPRFVYRAQLSDGTLVDLFSHQPPDEQQSRLEVYRWARTQFWRRYHTNLMLPLDQLSTATEVENFSNLRQQLLIFLVNNWNKTHGSDQQVTRAELLCIVRAIMINPSDAPETRQTWATYPEQ
jgi:hypothetical protein